MTIPGSPDDGKVADFNNDGHLDHRHHVARRGASMGVPRQRPRGIRRAGHHRPAEHPRELVTADFNRDGNVDLALAGNGTGPLVMILLGNGNGTFQAATTIGTATASSSLVVDDFNNDGNPDLALHTDNVGLTIILGNGVSGFQPRNVDSGAQRVGSRKGRRPHWRRVRRSDRWNRAADRPE